MGRTERSENHHSNELSGILYTNSALLSLRQTLADVVTTSWAYQNLFISALDVALPPPSMPHQNPNCGVQAFKALFPRAGDAAHHEFNHASANGWMNRRSMETALKKVGGKYQVLPGQLPRTGLALIEWTGTWRTEGFWGSDLKHTHWVAMAEGFVYDVNWSGWLPRQIWEEVVLDDVIANLPKATGWRPHTGYELA